MPSPSTIELKINTTADTAGLEQTTAGVRKLEEATRTGTVTASAAVRGQEALDAATKKTQTTTANTGHTMLTFGRILQDGVAAGLPGMVNNFEGLAMALGLGSGVAGAVTVLAVGFQVLMPLLTATDDKARKAAEAQRELEASTRKAAIEAAEQARSAEKAAAAQEAMENAIRRANRAYEDQVTASGAARKAKEEEIRLRLVEGDAAAELSMAEIDNAAARGAISPEEAERRKNAVARDSETRKFQADQDRKKAEEADKVNRANAERERAAAALIAAGDVAQRAEGLLTPAQRAEAEDRAKEAEALATRERDRLRSVRGEEGDVYAMPAGGAPLPPEVMQEREARFRARVQDAQRRAKDADEKARAQRSVLEADQAAQNRSGFDSPEEAQKRIRDLETEAMKRQTDAEKLSGEASGSAAGRGRESAAFETRRRAMDLRGETESLRSSQRDEMERQKRGQDSRREREAQAAVERAASAAGEGTNFDAVLKSLERMAQAVQKSGQGNAAMAAKIREIEDKLTEANAALATMRSVH